MDCGMNLVIHAASTEHCDASSFAKLLELGPNINAKDRIGRTALHQACRAGRVEIFELLIDVDGVDIDAITNAGVTPLMMAIESGNI